MRRSLDHKVAKAGRNPKKKNKNAVPHKATKSTRFTKKELNPWWPFVYFVTLCEKKGTP